ncbi:hypothetical protein KIH27_16785 [Mycobacterium sp. M1]|uniref:PE-PPE domain-containing protein n=1 Tax=Mycolicibacter acidiphilus TaxID=2835306 RepID=A0ABS5RLQ9_9MYCO|nr:hypothetical protein [Mycolicibacter acidiphilus]MBS9535246.1 hypothetical protein [Mycolicibacter acidiphilus]
MDAAKRVPDAKVTALAAAGVVAAALVTPVPMSPWLTAVERELQLVNGADSLMNVPLNLFQALVNVPSTELGGMTELGNALIYSGNWWSPSATNIWGEDPGDPGHFLGIFDMMFPFAAISGQGTPEPGAPGFSWDDAAAGHLGLGQQFTLLADAEIPVSPSSDADYSAPLLPSSEITGSSFFDHNAWFFASLFGAQSYPLFDNWFKVPLSDLQNGYTFPTAVDPSMGIGTNAAGQPDGSVPGDTTLGFAGTHPATPADIKDLPQDAATQSEGIHVVPGTDDVVNGNGNPVNLMPWSNETFKLDLMYPFQHFFNDLQAPVDPTTYADGFQIPTFEEIGRALQTLTAGEIIAFDPSSPGDPFCGTTCLDNPSATPLALVSELNKMWPGNASLEDWLTQANTENPMDAFYGMANGPTPHQVDVNNAVSQSLQQWFDIGNPSTDNPPTNVDTPISFPTSPMMQQLTDFMKESGVQQFFADWAKLAGYQPVNFDDLTPVLGASAPDPTDAGSAAFGASDGFTNLLDGLGLGSLGGLL